MAITPSLSMCKMVRLTNKTPAAKRDTTEKQLFVLVLVNYIKKKVKLNQRKAKKQN